MLTGPDTKGSFLPLLSHKYERQGLCITAKDRIPAADGLSKVLPLHVSRYYLWDIVSFYQYFFIYSYTAVPLTVRGMEWDPLPETVCRMDAAFVRTWTYLQRVSDNGPQFMSRIRATLVNACYISLFR